MFNFYRVHLLNFYDVILRNWLPVDKADLLLKRNKILEGWLHGYLFASEFTTVTKMDIRLNHITFFDLSH